MYSAEPLPHFVDEYLAYLYEVHPTNATFDGVHVHDDLLEDLRRIDLATDRGLFTFTVRPRVANDSTSGTPT